MTPVHFRALLMHTHYDRSRTGREFIVLVSCNSGVRRAEWVPCHAVNMLRFKFRAVRSRSNVAFMSFNLTFLTSVLTV
jgi:hypothetical protein